MPYSIEAYAMAIASEIRSLEAVVRHLVQLIRHMQGTLDSDFMRHKHGDIRENMQELIEQEHSLRTVIQMRGLQLASLVSPFPWPVHHGEKVIFVTYAGRSDSVLTEYDEYVSGM